MLRCENTQLHTQDKIRRAAVRSWADLAGQAHPLPSTLLDLLPALLADVHVAVSALQLIDRLDIPRNGGRNCWN